jgi:acyl-CoA thioester hydrolase
MSRPQPPSRDDFAVFRPIGTRWMDDDAYGHANNVVYYAWFDTVVNAWVPRIGVVAETGCTFFSSVSFPQTLDIGLSVERLGERSITYRLGVFVTGSADCAALGRFVHVYVDATTRRSAPVPPEIRNVVEPLLRGPLIRAGSGPLSPTG